LSLPQDVTIARDLTITRDTVITGNLTVNGTTTSIDTNTLQVKDNIIVLNDGVTGTPSTNAGIEIERGTSTNASVTWNETTDKWTAGLTGAETEISLSGHTHVSTDVTDFTEAVQDVAGAAITAGTGIGVSYSDAAGTITVSNSGILAVSAGTGISVSTVSGTATVTSSITQYTDEMAQDTIGAIASGSNSLSVTYTDATPSLVFDTTLATTSYLSKTSGLAVDASALGTKLVTDGFTKKYSTSVGDAAATSYAVTHNLGTRDVTVNVYDNSTYDTVECDVVRTSTSVVTVSFSTAPASNAYRVVVVG
jgi:hypothetical protein